MTTIEVGMKNKHRECLRLNYIFLIKELNLESLHINLIENKVMKEDWIENIMAQPIKQRRHEMLISQLKCAGPKAWSGFLSSLEDAHQGHIAWRLKETEKLYEANPKIEASKVKEYFKENQTPSEFVPALPDRNSLVQMNSLAHSGSRTSFRDEEDCYTMKTNPRGFMLIINNIDFEDGQEKRMGSDADRDRLKKVFQDIGFHIEDQNNCSKEKMLNRIKGCAEDANEFKDVDSTVVAILSHGEDDKIFGTDGLAITIDDLIRPFNGYNSPNLVGKPKLFILQMCRGRDYRTSVPKADGPLKGLGPSPSFVVEGGEVPEPVLFYAETDNEEEELRKRVAGLHISDQKKAERFLHPDVDMVLAYSTLPGHLSYRDEEKGSWYIQALCNIFVKYAREEHVMDMLIRANNEITKFGTESNVQCAEPRTRLRKKWYLNPMY